MDKLDHVLKKNKILVKKKTAIIKLNIYEEYL